MPKIFVSYSRSDKAKVKTLIPLLREDYGLDNVWWDENFYGGQVWLEEILQQIAQCDVFVYLMSPRSLGSPYCQAELEEARRLRKPILPVKLRRDTSVPDILAKMQYINLAGVVNRATIAPLRRSINEHASHPPSALPPLTPTPVSMPQIPPREPRNLWVDYGVQIVIGIIVTVIGGLILAMMIQQLSQNAAATLTTITTPDPLALARIPVTHNADWTPVTQDFNGVTMVLVPAGCFMMGSNDGGEDEQPVHEQCIEAPFWIDRTEVTNEAFDSTVADCTWWSSEAEQPRICITWFDARDYCASRGARLPTEREWEYAARGPNNLIYPWGNTWNENNAVWNGNSNGGAANVGSRPSAASWVGALDMSGNLWEWTSTIYEPYPYVATDRREDDTGYRTDIRRVLRGGSFYGSTDDLRAPTRIRYFPINVLDVIGVRYALSP
ncbi:MAG: SUMF1/EgtB/PvdO family nonheme iron enzyme [Chloroflexota bacterium]|nr:SUMF1/EgtB/PvdO family nonheme iron enzyme [Chloroflexota bacterium]